MGLIATRSLEAVAVGVQDVVPVDINSGNPRYPFPQFLDYINATATLANLARVNPVGVPHMEMEKRIRDAWQIFANQFEYTGASWAGVNYINPSIGCSEDPQCSEGLGYALLAAAYMGDKTTYDGLWFFAHDTKLQMEPTYATGVIAQPGYVYGKLPRDASMGSLDSAADGDFDIAMATLMAWYQWGDLQGSVAFNGTPISYKAEALGMMQALVDQAPGTSGDPCRLYSGDIGFDGYSIGGNSQGDLTTWALGQCPGPAAIAGNTYADYSPPAYFHEFYKTLQTPVFSAVATPWEVSQLQRGEASGDWLMGQLYSQGYYPFASQVSVVGITPTFTDGGAGETFRNGWRTILNYVWHGNSATSWDPANHAISAIGNQFEYNNAMRLAALLANPESVSQSCTQVTASAGHSIQFQGAQSDIMSYFLNGTPNGTFNLNWMDGTGSPAVVAAQDFKTMAKMFRQCVIEWDITAPGDNYLTSVPFYFHGFFRLLGMLMLTGDLQAPSSLAEPDTSQAIPANMKIYKSVNRTFAFPGDTVTYTLSYRNYASVPATGVTITDALPTDLTYLSSTGGINSGGTVTFNIGTVPGLVGNSLASYAATAGSVTLVATVNAGTVGDHICNVATIACSNGTGWTSNQYPNDPLGAFDGTAVTNEQQAVMQRNCVDIVPTALSLTKSASISMTNPNDTVTYTLAYANSQVPFLDGGRPGVDVTFANGGVATSTQLNIGMQIWHDADDAYINYKNYRISYYMNQPAYPAGSWTAAPQVYLGGLSSGVTVTQENLTPGPTWDQRIIIQCADEMATITPMLYEQSGQPTRIHQGGLSPLLAIWRIFATGYPAVNWAGDWSADPLANDTANQGDAWYPVSPDYTNPVGPGVPITQVYPDECQPVPTGLHQVTNVLIEEWDGYTWRRVFGTGPVSGRPMTNVVISDPLPTGVTFGGFVGTTGTVSAGVVSWNIPVLEVNQSGTVAFWVTTNNVACPVNELITNQASIVAQNEDPVYAAVGVSLTCNPLPTPVPAFLKSALPASTNVGGDITYNLNYTAPNPVSTVSDAFTNAATLTNWTQMPANNSWTLAGGTLTDNNWATTGMADTQTLAGNTTVTANISVPASQWGGLIVRASAANTYYAAEASPNGALGQIKFIKVVAGVTTVISSTPASLPLPAGYFGFELIANGSNFFVQYNTGSGWVNPFGGAITDTSITGTGWGGVYVGASGVGFQAFSAAVDRMAMTITDSTPANTTYVSSANAPASNPVVGGTGLVTWNLGTVLSGTYVSETLVVQVSACPASGYVNNQALLTGAGINSNLVSTTITCGTATYSPTRTLSPSSTATATPSASPTATPSASPSATPSATSSPSPSPSATPTLTATATPSPSPSDSPTLTATATPSPSPSDSPTLTATATSSASPSATPSFSATPSVSPSGTSTPVASATATASISPSPTASPSPSSTGTLSPSATASPSPSSTGTQSPSATATASPTASSTVTASFSPSNSPSATPSASPSLSATASYTASPVYTATASPSASPTATASPTSTWTATVTASFSPSATPSATATASVTPSATLTATPTPSFSFSATASFSPTVTLTRTESATLTATVTASRTATATPSATASATASLTATLGPSFTLSPTKAVQYYQQPPLIENLGIYPNPFSDNAQMYFKLRVAAHVTLQFYNVAGEPVYHLEMDSPQGIQHTLWQGINEVGARCASGVYILHFQADGLDQSRGDFWANLVIMR